MGRLTTKQSVLSRAQGYSFVSSRVSRSTFWQMRDSSAGRGTGQPGSDTRWEASLLPAAPPGPHTGRRLVRGLGPSQGRMKGAGLRAGPGRHPAEGTPGGQPAAGSTGRNKSSTGPLALDGQLLRGPHTRRPRAQGTPGGPSFCAAQGLQRRAGLEPREAPPMAPLFPGQDPPPRPEGWRLRSEPVPGTHRLGAPLLVSLHLLPQLLRKPTGRPLP